MRQHPAKQCRRLGGVDTRCVSLGGLAEAGVRFPARLDERLLAPARRRLDPKTRTSTGDSLARCIDDSKPRLVRVVEANPETELAESAPKKSRIDQGWSSVRRSAKRRASPSEPSLPIPCGSQTCFAETLRFEELAKPSLANGLRRKACSQIKRSHRSWRPCFCFLKCRNPEAACGRQPAREVHELRDNVLGRIGGRLL